MDELPTSSSLDQICEIYAMVKWKSWIVDLRMGRIHPFFIRIQMSMISLGCSGLGHQAGWVWPEVSNSLKGGKLWIPRGQPSPRSMAFGRKCWWTLKMRVTEKKVSFMYISNKYQTISIYIYAYIYKYTYPMREGERERYIYLCVSVCAILQLTEMFFWRHLCSHTRRLMEKRLRFGDPPAVCSWSTGLRCWVLRPLQGGDLGHHWWWISNVYLLVNLQKTMENHNCSWENPL